MCVKSLMSILRVLLFKSKPKHLPVCNKSVSRGLVTSNMSDTAIGRLRYVGGKRRYMHYKSIKSNCNKTSAQAISKYYHSKVALDIFDVIKVSEHHIMSITTEVGSSHAAGFTDSCG